MGGVSLDPAHHRIDPDPGVYIQQELHRIWQHFHLNDGTAVFVLLFDDQRFDPVVNRWHKYLPSILRAKDNLFLAAVHNGSVPV